MFKSGRGAYTQGDGSFGRSDYETSYIPQVYYWKDLRHTGIISFLVSHSSALSYGNVHLG